jgi:hypothetical protein
MFGNAHWVTRFCQRKGWPTPDSPRPTKPELRFILPTSLDWNHQESVLLCAQPSFDGDTTYYFGLSSSFLAWAKSSSALAFSPFFS